jgi:o-succinylbenzoate synthase
MIASACKDGCESASHVLIHPHVPQERADPSFTVTHTVSTDIAPFLSGVSDVLAAKGLAAQCSSQLAPLVTLGRMLQTVMKSIIFEASETTSTSLALLTEPQIMVALSESFATRSDERALFLSNSMPIRDAEFFLYPMMKVNDVSGGPTCVGANRGASGIDGIISSALGFCESTETATTLVIGDMAGLHDVGSFHSMADCHKLNHAQGKKRMPLTTVVVNNDGGGIFSFLPIAKHGKDVSFDEFFGTPTNTFSFEKGAESFGLPFRRATSFDSFQSQYNSAVDSRKDSVLEAKVVDRQMNVAVHHKISERVESFVSSTLTRRQIDQSPDRLPIKVYTHPLNGAAPRKTMILLHGWMGDKLEWDRTVDFMIERLDRDWKIVSIDLPGHGGSPLSISSDVQILRRALRIDDEDAERKSHRFDLDAVATTVLETLSIHHQVEKIDALVGYSAGGRVALAMKRLCLSSAANNLITGETALVLLGAFPGDIGDDARVEPEENVDKTRSSKDEKLAQEIVSLCDKWHLSGSETESSALMAGCLERWYRSPIWGEWDLSKQYKMIGRRTRHLLRRGRDLALFLVNSSPARNQRNDGRYCSLNRTLFIAGSLDTKYKSIGKEMNRKDLAQYQEIEGCGHAVLAQNPRGVADRIVSFLGQECEETAEYLVRDKPLSPMISRNADPGRSQGGAAAMKPNSSVPVWATPTDALDAIDSLKFVPFAIELMDGRKKKQVTGIGWGPQSRASKSSTLSTREGFVIQIVCANGLEVGLGEVSPLPGLHPETLEQAKNELELLQQALASADIEALPPFDATSVLAMNGTLSAAVTTLAQFVGLPKFVPSVRSGIEMALISLAAQKTSFPVHQALVANESPPSANTRALGLLPLNGLITRAPSVDQVSSFDQFSFPSYKVKVGHQDLRDDTTAILSGFRRIEIYHGRLNGRLRADANRAWNESQTIAFAMALEGLDVNAFEKFEFIEEPLQKVKDSNAEWTLDLQVTALERSYFETAIAYALDESLADLAESHDWEFEKVKETLESTFQQGSRGCAALILKPSLLGMELSLRLARLARQHLGIGAVFSSSFDSGLGLAHTAFLGYISDQIPSKAKTYPHGLGTFSMLGSDTLIPAFGSYVNSEGSLNVPSMSRALYGLSIDEIQDCTIGIMPDSATETSAYEASTAQSSNGNEISVAVSFPLPFSAETACSRFTDLPSMSRWSPWISSVRYLGTETEWTINIRGIPLTWRAASQVVTDPFPGIQWQSVSGLNNRGIVEFVADESTSDASITCTMNVRMTIVTPRVLRPLFQGTSLFLEEFLRNKLLKWSLEMFRDVVKADLALER